MFNSVMPMMLGVAVPNMFEGVTSTMFMGILDQILKLVPIVLPAIIGFLAFRKGWEFIKSAVRGA